MIGKVSDQIKYMLSEGMSNFINDIQFHADTVFNLETHGENKYGWIDLDFNQTTTYDGCKEIYKVINKCADDRCLVSIWNAVGMKHLKFEDQQAMINEVIVNELSKDFIVLDDEEITYEDTALMYVRILKLQRR